MKSLALALMSVSLILPASAQGWTLDDGTQVEIPRGTRSLGGGEEGPEGMIVSALLDEATPEDGPAVSVAMMRSGVLVGTASRGVADRERNVPCSANTRFDIASVSKSVTAAAIATLAKRGELDLDASVREHLPELAPAFAAATVRDLVHHMSGIEDTEGLLALAGWCVDDVGTHADGLRVLFAQRTPRFEPGTRFLYSNGGYVLLAEIVTRVTGEPFPEWVSRTLFAPVGLDSARLLTGHGELISDRAVPSDFFDGSWRRRRESTRFGAGGVVCTAADLARWGDELRAGDVLGESVVEMMKTPGTLRDGSPHDYAFGLSRGTIAGREAWLHAGSVRGGQSVLMIVPSEEVVIAVTTNSSSGLAPGIFAREIAGVLLGPSGEIETSSAPRMIVIPETQSVPERSQGVTVDAAQVAQYAGSYAMEDPADGTNFTLSVATEGDTLRIGFDDVPTLDVFPLPSGRFLIAPANYELEFDADRDQATMHVTEESIRNGEPRAIVGRRVDTTPLAAERVAALTGFYRHAELSATYEVVSSSAGLVLRHPRHGDLAMTRLSGEVFTLPGRSLARAQFIRDTDDVVALELTAYSWGVAARFERVTLR